MTARQTEVLGFIRFYLETHGYSPSVRDVAAHFEITVNGAAGHIAALERKGAIKKAVSVARSIRVVDGRSVDKNQLPTNPCKVSES